MGFIFVVTMVEVLQFVYNLHYNGFQGKATIEMRLKKMTDRNSLMLVISPKTIFYTGRNSISHFHN